MNHILLVEDNPESQDLFVKIIGNLAQVTVCGDATSAIDKLQAGLVFDLAVIDLNLPDKDGLELCYQIKNSPQQKHMPLFILSSRIDVQDKITGFSIGVDDYIVKPYDPRELKIRIYAKLKKLKETSAEGLKTNLQFHDLSLDLKSQKAFVNGPAGAESCKLTQQEFKLIWFLAQTPKTVYTREQLLEAIWGNDSDVQIRNIDSFISRVRKKIAHNAFMVQSVYGGGYTFCSDKIHS